jgi:hypothetical protein
MNKSGDSERFHETLTDMKVDMAEVKAGVKTLTENVNVVVNEVREMRKTLHEPPHEVIARLKVVETQIASKMGLKDIVGSTWFKMLLVAILTALGAKNIEGIM